MDVLKESSGGLVLRGERFKAIYHLTASAEKVKALAQDICIEQTIEFPEDLVGRRDIREQIFGQVISLRTLAPGRHEAVVQFAVEIAGNELTQLLNVLFGNISLKPGIRLVGLDLPDSLLREFRGPRFGRQGLRELLAVPRRPLLGTALKPMGLSPQELADLAFRFALGGMDIIKDDHGLADQSFCPFIDRVARCAEAVQRANRQTGRHCLYFPNVTAPADRIIERASRAKELGAGGLVVSPGLTGVDAMRQLADDDRLALPILSHPALQGSFTVRACEGISHGVLFGCINRLAGADACIFPNYGGRFNFSAQDCLDLLEGTGCELGHLRTIFPIPAGGMLLDRVTELLGFYGSEVILLIGGDLHRHGPDLTENCRKFARLVKGAAD